jgi:hypothetical protein
MAMDRSEVVEWLRTRLEWERRLAELDARRREQEAVAPAHAPSRAPIASADRESAARLVVRLWSSVRGMSAGRAPSGSEHDRASASVVVVG